MSSSSSAPDWKLGPWAAPTSSWGSDKASTYYIPWAIYGMREISGLRRAPHVRMWFRSGPRPMPYAYEFESKSLQLNSANSQLIHLTATAVNSNRGNYPLLVAKVLSLFRTADINDKLRIDEVVDVDVDQVTHCERRNLTSYHRRHK